MTILGGLLLMLTAVALAAAPVGAEDVVKLGQIEAQTGPNAIYGWMSSQGTALAVDEGNKAGGFSVGARAYKIQLTGLDTRVEAKQATHPLERLIYTHRDNYRFQPFL